MSKESKDMIEFNIANKGKIITEEDAEIIEKSLKALEIIKNKRVDVNEFIEFMKYYDDTYYGYQLEFENNAIGINLGREELTEEEFDLLKEVLL